MNMKIAVIGATGIAGQAVFEEADGKRGRTNRKGSSFK